MGLDRTFELSDVHRLVGRILSEPGQSWSRERLRVEYNSSTSAPHHYARQRFLVLGMVLDRACGFEPSRRRQALMSLLRLQVPRD